MTFTKLPTNIFINICPFILVILTLTNVNKTVKQTSLKQKRKNNNEIMVLTRKNSFLKQSGESCSFYLIHKYR